MILSLLFTASVKAQQDEVTIDKRRNGATAAPGQMLLVFLSKSSERLIPPPPLNHFEVLVIQDGITYVAQVRSVTSGLIGR
jgi:hypothetical protein